MANVIISKWDETPGERAEREKGHRVTERGIAETGLTFIASRLRKNNAPGLMQDIAKALQAVCGLMADQKWDDEKVVVVIGIQARNKWEIDCDGEPVEIGSVPWMDAIARKALRK